MTSWLKRNCACGGYFNADWTDRLFIARRQTWEMVWKELWNRARPVPGNRRSNENSRHFDLKRYCRPWPFYTDWKGDDKNPLTVIGKTSVASAAQMMVWEGIEVLPVVNDHAKLIGMISRQDVLKALQMIQKQPQVGEKLDDVVSRGFKEADTEKPKQMRCTNMKSHHKWQINSAIFRMVCLHKF